MSKLQIINDPKEFLKAISQPSDDFFLLQEKIFEPMGDIYDKISYINEKYKVQSLYTDIIISSEDQNIETVQYYSDIENPNLEKIVFSPICSRYIKNNYLKLHENLNYQSFSLLKQLCKQFFPWHIAEIGFKANLTQIEFNKIFSESQWVLQNVI